MSAETQNIETFRAQGVLRALDVHLARTLGRISGVTDHLVLLGAASASRAQGAGHVCLQLRTFDDQVRGEEIKVGLVDWPDAGTWRARLQACTELVRDSASERRTPLVLEGEHLYLDRYWGYQQRLVKQVRGRIGQGPSDIDEAWLAGTLTRLFPLAEDAKELQKKAAEMAYRSRFAIITGGPGTGKTTTIKRLLALLIEDARRRGETDPRVVLMAPTGKASARMKESIQAQDTHVPLNASDEVVAAFPKGASTIHRALGWTPKHRTRFKRNADSPLAADVVIVDEASMVDQAMMTKVFEAVAPGARLILLGDADQLKSIESGAVLGDLVEGLGDEGVVKLEYAHRFGADSGVGALSRAINRGALDTVRAYLAGERTEDPNIARYDELTWLPLTEQDSLQRLKEVIKTTLRKRIIKEMTPFREAVMAKDWKEALKALDGFRVLAAHRNGPLGVNGLNKTIESWLAHHKSLGFSTKREHYVGRPILITSNDKEQELYNGDVGFIGTNDAGQPVGIFPDSEGYRQVPVARLPPHETVYAMTIHKSQGSQFTHALVALPVEPSRIVTRELLYTAVTRAAKYVTIIGSEASLEAGVKQKVSRTSGLSDALRRDA